MTAKVWLVVLTPMLAVVLMFGLLSGLGAEGSESGGTTPASFAAADAGHQIEPAIEPERAGAESSIGIDAAPIDSTVTAVGATPTSTARVPGDVAAATTLVVPTSGPPAAEPPVTAPSVAPSSTAMAPTVPAATGSPVPVTAPPSGGVTSPPHERVIGFSTNGVSLVARRYGTGGGIPVLGVGTIHGDEAAGLRIVEALRRSPVPTGIELWLIDTVNPDGTAANTRENASGVDLNRNFDSGDWQLVGEGTERYSGTVPASEPETKAVQTFLQEIRPKLAVWWHQVGNHVDENPLVADHELLVRFAEHAGLPRMVTPCGTPCVGNATTYVNSILGGTSFVVELPEQVDDTTVASQAQAFIETARSLIEQ